MSDTEKEDNILWITGHSRGAAVASLVAGTFSTDKDYRKLVDRDHIFGYTFAGPTFSTSADPSLKNIYNFCNEGDLVTQLPPTNFKFKRYGQTITISKKQQSDIKKRYRYLSGTSYKGYMSRPAAFDFLSKWVGKPKNYEKKEKMNVWDYLKVQSGGLAVARAVKKLNGGKWTYFSKYEILSACATFLQREEKEEQIKAASILAVALLTDQLPTDVAALYLGENAVKKLTQLKVILNIPGALDEFSNSFSYIAHSHCQELYYAWVEIL